MKTSNTRQNKGFTLLEILLVIAAIGILAAIVIVAINPLRQIGKARDATRLASLNTLQKALEQYYISNGRYPDGVIAGEYIEICVDGNTIECVDLEDDLVPTYIAEIPKDPQGGGFKVGINPGNESITLIADKAEITANIETNPITLASGNRDIRFNTGRYSYLDNIVLASAIQSDNKVVIGGIFNQLEGSSSNHIARLNTDGSRDITFNVGEGFNKGEYQVRDIAIQNIAGQEKILAVGEFSSYKGVLANRIIRLNSDGSIDTSFDMGSGFNDDIYTIKVQNDNKILVGGYFSEYNGQSARGIIRLNSDGSRDTSFDVGTGFDGFFLTMDIETQDILGQPKIIIVGVFSSYRGVVANDIVRLNDNGTRDTNFDMGTGFSGSLPFTSGLDCNIVVQSDGKIIVGNDSTTYRGDTINGIVRINDDGTRDTSFDMGTGFSAAPYGLSIQTDGKIVVGGWATRYNDEITGNIIRLNTNGSRDITFESEKVKGLVFDVDLYSDNRVFVSGQVNSDDSGAAQFLTKLNINGKRDTSWSLRDPDNTRPGFNGRILAFKVQQDGKIIYTGGFSKYQGVSANKIIRLNPDGSRDTSFDMGTGFNDSVGSVVITSDNKIMVSGTFSEYNGQSVDRIIRLNNDGSLDNTFNLDNSLGDLVGIIDVLKLGGDDKLMIRETILGTSNHRLIRLNMDGTIDNTLGSVLFTGPITGIASQSTDKIIVVGSFTEYNGLSVNRIIRLNADGSIDNSFSLVGNFNNVLRGNIEIQSDDKILVVGNYTSYNGQSANRLIRFNPDGSKDTSFNIGTGFNNITEAIKVQSDGKIIVVGRFTSYNGTTGVNRIVRLNSNGSLDTEFNVGKGIGFNTWAIDLDIMPDGGILVSGDFYTYNGSALNGNVVKIVP